MNRRLLLIGCAVVLVVGAVVAVVVVRDRTSGPDTRLAAAVALAPKGTDRLTWTDWAGIRDELGSDVSIASSAEEVRSFLDAGFDADLVSTTALRESAETLHGEYGLSPATIDWELLAQSEDGALVVVGLPEAMETAELADTLDSLGYDRPEDDDGVWEVSSERLVEIGGVSPQLTNIRIDEERRVLVASDRVGYAEDWPGDVRGDDVEDGITEVVAATGSPLSASVYSGDHACTALAMSQADGADRARGAELIEEAGAINPLDGFGIAALPGGDVLVTMAFESEEQARTNAGTRAVLASGPAPGQGGEFADRFDLGEVAAEGRVVTMELMPVEGTFPMSDLATGPVLFATC